MGGVDGSCGWKVWMGVVDGRRALDRMCGWVVEVEVQQRVRPLGTWRGHLKSWRVHS